MKQMEVIVRNGLPVVSMNEKRSMTIDKYEWIGETCEYERERERERKEMRLKAEKKNLMFFSTISSLKKNGGSHFVFSVSFVKKSG